MADVTIVYWRDMPAQVIVGKGRRGTKLPLPERFEQAIDRAAMKSGAAESTPTWKGSAKPHPTPLTAADAECRRRSRTHRGRIRPRAHQNPHRKRRLGLTPSLKRRPSCPCCHSARKKTTRTVVSTQSEAFLKDYSIEVMPRTAEKVEDFRELLPAGTRVYIAHIEGTPIEDMVATAKRADCRRL